MYSEPNKYEAEKACRDNSPSRMDSAIHDVARLVEEMDGLLTHIKGPRTLNQQAGGTKTPGVSPVPTLASILDGGPDRLRTEVKRGTEIMNEIRVALGI